MRARAAHGGDASPRPRTPRWRTVRSCGCPAPGRHHAVEIIRQFDGAAHALLVDPPAPVRAAQPHAAAPLDLALARLRGDGSMRVNGVPVTHAPEDPPRVDGL